MKIGQWVHTRIPSKTPLLSGIILLTIIIYTTYYIGQSASISVATKLRNYLTDFHEISIIINKLNKIKVNQ